MPMETTSGKTKKVKVRKKIKNYIEKLVQDKAHTDRILCQGRLHQNKSVSAHALWFFCCVCSLTLGGEGVTCLWRVVWLK